MLRLQTAIFGELEINEQDIINFKQGIPGFEHLRAFVIVRPDEELPFVYLLAMEQPETMLILCDPFSFYPDYELKLSDEVLEELHIETESDVLVWSIVTIRDNLETATINLLAPLVMNVKQRFAKQIILNSGPYETKHPLFRETQSTGDGVR